MQRERVKEGKREKVSDTRNYIFLREKRKERRTVKTAGEREKRERGCGSERKKERGYGRWREKERK